MDEDGDVELEEVTADGRIFRRRIVRGARFGFMAACVAVAVAVAEVPSTAAAVSSLDDEGDCSGEFIMFDDTEWCIPLSLAE